ncbi:taurine ABC transporter substrate-binding protein [Leisingera sp. M523]|uniref:taurine ABC transporter substrate-binding protein n=1 Tax=Leisingera sp. M523 TaxID=2867013 RepID=UPI0021A75080|nr:taurine ABC transporter substrate-binding protein [Leisingera sp. M523]UWQ29274.1 taurine ABC transporter substrate-binding protein [Leisingera sp. M523]
MKAVRWVILALFCSVLFSGRGASALDDVTIGYQLMYNPWKTAIVSGEIEQAVGQPVTWRKFESGAKVINSMILGKVQIAQSGSSPIAAGISRGLDIEVVWILEDIAAAEALVVRDGAGIIAPRDLAGKTIGVPFASTTHFHFLFALEQFGIAQKDVVIRNMQPQEITEAWQLGEIDAAFVWDPALSEIKKSGKVLITSGVLSSWGKATFDAMVVDRTFAAQNPNFMCNLIKTVAAADADYNANPSAWTSGSDQVAAIVSLAGGDPENVPVVLDLYDFPTLREQASARWLGGGTEGRVAQALSFTAEFLREQGKIRNVVDDFARHVNPRYVEMVLEGAC